MNERSPPRSAIKPPVGRKGATSRRKWPWIVFGSLVGIVALTVVVGSAMAGSIVRGKLELLAKEAGLTLTLQDVSVSPLGKAHLSGLVFKRGDGSSVFALQEAHAEFSVWKLLMGKRRPNSTQIKVFQLDVLLDDGKPKEMLELYKAARKIFPRKEKQPNEPEDKSVSTSAFALEQGGVTIRVKGKGSQYLPQGLRAHDIAVHLDLANGIGDLSAMLDGTVASKLSASLVPQKDGPPKLQAKFAPEFRLKMPDNAPLPLGVDSVAVTGFGFDAVDGPAIEDVTLRKGEQVVLSVKRVRPDRTGGLGVRAETIAFSVPEKAAAAAVPAPDAPKPKGKKPGAPAAPPPPNPSPTSAAVANKGPRIWNGTAESLTLALSGGEGAEIGIATRLNDLKVTIPGDVGVIGVAAVELRTDRMPGEHPMEALVALKVEQPSADLPWREDAMDAVPGGKYLWKAITAAETAKLRAQIEDDVEEEIIDPELPPDQRRKKVEAKVAEKLRAAGVAVEKPGDKKATDKKAADKKTGDKADDGKRQPGAAKISAVTQYIKPLRDLHEKLLGLDALIQKALDKVAEAPRLKVEVIGGRFGLVRPSANKPFGGVQDITLTWSAVDAAGLRALQVTAKPFDDERQWGEITADLHSGPGSKLDAAHFKLQGGQFAQALRVVSSSVMVKADSDIALNLELKLGQAAASRLTITGDFLVKKIGFDWWRLAPKPLEDLNASGKLSLDVQENDGSMKLEFSELAIGKAYVKLLLEATGLRDKPTVHIRTEMPKQDCGAVAKSIPPSMLSTIGTIEAKGDISWMVDLVVPLQGVYKATLDLALDDEKCEVERFSGVNVDELAVDFVRPVNENGILLDDVMVGPSSGSWVPLADLPAWTKWSMIATEDGAFYKHRGIRPGLLLRAIRLDLDYGRFVYGGSTITQQLVKNIYLTRAKNLSRKFEELLIVWQMERRLQKDRILEMYVNMIEFGPKVYGIARAAQAYFAKDATKLSPLESAFLAANKPCPRCGNTVFQNGLKGGSKAWTQWWAERTIGILTKMRNDGVIDDIKYNAELGMIPKFVGWPETQVAPVPLLEPVDGDAVPTAGVEE